MPQPTYPSQMPIYTQKRRDYTLIVSLNQFHQIDRGPLHLSITTMPGGDSITTTDTYSAAAEDESKEANVFRNTQAGFEGLKLSSELMKALYEEMKFVRPSKFQSMILPMILTPPYKNLIALAPTCSGKTTCFLLGMFSRVDPTLPAPQALCICPSIELAVQNMEVLLKMGKFTGITSDLFIPADKANYIPVTAQVIIGTPGTINRLITAKKLGTSHLKILVFEEADYLLVEVILWKFVSFFFSV
ncbi:putative RNA helicase [Helianthus annuus]|nr:putative RNA helicase [Helianthus annuus]